MMETHDCISTDGVTFTCPTCGREYRCDDGLFMTIVHEGDPNVLHVGEWGITIKSVDATVPAGPARPEIFSRN